MKQLAINFKEIEARLEISALKCNGKLIVGVSHG